MSIAKVIHIPYVIKPRLMLQLIVVTDWLLRQHICMVRNIKFFSKIVPFLFFERLRVEPLKNLEENMAIRFQGVKTKTREPYYFLRSQPVGVGFGLVQIYLTIQHQVKDFNFVFMTLQKTLLNVIDVYPMHIYAAYAGGPNG